MDKWTMQDGGFSYRGGTPMRDAFLLRTLNLYEEERDDYRDRGIKGLIVGTLIGAASSWLICMILLIILGLVF